MDAQRQIHARIQGADFDQALAIARSVFPELASELKIVLRRKLRSAELQESNATPALTPEGCARHGVIPSSVVWVHALRQRFVRTAAAGGGR